MERLKQERVALYGGTFDPVHVGHLSVARRITALFDLDRVLFIPAYVAPHKRAAPPSASAFHRYAMLALATQAEARMLISSVEIEAPERPYTVETLARFEGELGQSARLFFVMGADSWSEITTWFEWERLLSMIDHIVVTRPGYEVTTSHVTEAVRKRIIDLRGIERTAAQETISSTSERIYITDAVMLDVSATRIRRATGGEDKGVVAALVPPPALSYIEKYQLYRDRE